MVTVAAEGSLLMDGTLQQLHENTENKVHEGSVDLTPLLSGDTIVVKTQQRLKSGGAYVPIGSDRTFNGPVTDQDKSLNFLPRAVKYGFRVQIQQTLGTFRTLDFIFFKT